MCDMSQARIFSLYWDNIDPAIVAAQKKVWDHMGMAVGQHRIHGLDHGEWMDWVLARHVDVDVCLFIDIDCIPLNRQRVVERMQAAYAGALVGAEGAANHLDPTRSYAGAWYVYMNPKIWDQFGRPSARLTRHADIAQNWTDVWRQQNASVQLIEPTACVTPKWDLPGRPLAYGIATDYGDDCFHLFQSRNAQAAQWFLARCEKIVGSI